MCLTGNEQKGVWVATSNALIPTPFSNQEDFPDDIKRPWDDEDESNDGTESKHTHTHTHTQVQRG